MRLRVKMLGNNNRSDILQLSQRSIIRGCEWPMPKKKSTYKIFIKAYRPHSFELLLLISVSKYQCSLFAVFNSLSKVIRVGFDFALWFPYDWFRKLASPSRPIRCKTKTSINWITRVFPAFHWILAIFPFVLIGCCDYFGFGLTSLNRKEPEMVFWS